MVAVNFTGRPALPRACLSGHDRESLNLLPSAGIVLLSGSLSRADREVARNVERLNLNASRDLARVIERSRIDQRQRRAVVLRFVLEGEFISVQRSGDGQVFVFLAFAGAGQLVISEGKFACLVAFVAGDVVVEGPLAGELGGCGESAGGKQKGGNCEDGFHALYLSGLNSVSHVCDPVSASSGITDQIAQDGLEGDRLLQGQVLRRAADPDHIIAGNEFPGVRRFVVNR